MSTGFGLTVHPVSAASAVSTPNRSIRRAPRAHLPDGRPNTPRSMEMSSACRIAGMMRRTGARAPSVMRQRVIDQPSDGSPNHRNKANATATLQRRPGRCGLVLEPANPHDRNSVHVDTLYRFAPHADHAELEEFRAWGAGQPRSTRASELAQLIDTKIGDLKSSDNDSSVAPP